MLPFLLAATLATSQIDTVINLTPIETIEDRNVCFGVKETVEELLIEKGYITTESKKGRYNLFFTISYSPFTIWLKEYEYDYNNINIDKIQRLFS